MSYSYETEKPFVFTEEGQVMFLKVRDAAKRLLSDAGAFRLEEVIRGITGDTWHMLACVDRLVELGEILECETPAYKAAQNRIFTDGGWTP